MSKFPLLELKIDGGNRISLKFVKISFSSVFIEILQQFPNEIKVSFEQVGIFHYVK